MAKMSLREKVGQMIQGDSEAIRPDELRDYPLGSVLSGGNSAPLDAKDDAPVQDWIRTTAAFRAVSIEERQGHIAIPLLYGIDSVHGSSNFKGAVVFPHNIGLGAMRDPALIEENRRGDRRRDRRRRCRLGLRAGSRGAARRPLGPQL